MLDRRVGAQTSTEMFSRGAGGKARPVPDNARGPGRAVRVGRMCRGHADYRGGRVRLRMDTRRGVRARRLEPHYMRRRQPEGAPVARDPGWRCLLPWYLCPRAAGRGRVRGRVPHRLLWVALLIEYATPPEPHGPIREVGSTRLGGTTIQPAGVPRMAPDSRPREHGTAAPIGRRVLRKVSSGGCGMTHPRAPAPVGCQLSGRQPAARPPEYIPVPGALPRGAGSRSPGCVWLG